MPAGPVNDLAQVFDSPQVAARGMRISLPHPLAAEGVVDLIGNPLRLSATPISYSKAPPTLGADTGTVLSRQMGLQPSELQALQSAGVIDGKLDA